MKILLIRNHLQGNQVRSLVADESALYWRSSESHKELEASVGNERFNLIIADYREARTDVLSGVESLRKLQPEAQIFLICKQLELEEVIRAIRLGVRDVFQVPLDFKSLAGRIESLVRNGDKFPGASEETALGRWNELAQYLSDAPAAEVAPAAAAKVAERKGHAVKVSDARLDAVVHERDRLAGEIEALKKKVTAAEDAQQQLQGEVTRATALKDQTTKKDDELRLLRQEQEILRAGLKTRNQAEATLKLQQQRLAEADAKLQAEKARVERVQAELERQAGSRTAEAEGQAAEQTAQLEMERAMLEQQRQGLAKQQAALKEETARSEAARKTSAQELSQREQAKAKRDLGVPAETVLRELGYAPGPVAAAE